MLARFTAKFLALVEKVTSALAFAPSFLTRAVLGYGFFLTGRGKWAHIDGLTDYFASLSIPHPHETAMLVATMELIGGAGLIAGLLTRFLASGLWVTMSVAIMTADKTKLIDAWRPDSDAVPTDVTSFAYWILLIWLIIYGAGPISMDWGIGKLLRGWARVNGQAAKKEQPPNPGDVSATADQWQIATTNES